MPFFYLWAVFSRDVASVLISVLCVVVVVATCFKMLTLFSERVSLVPLDSLVSLLNRYWFDLYAHSWLHLKDDDHIDIEDGTILSSTTPQEGRRTAGGGSELLPSSWGSSVDNSTLGSECLLSVF